MAASRRVGLDPEGRVAFKLGGPRKIPYPDDQFDLVVIDGPPVMGLADAPLLASVTAGTVLVVEAGTTRRGLARAAIRRLLTGQAHLLGAVLNKFSLRKAGYGYAYGYGYSYAYSYGYGANEPRIETKRK